MGDRHSRNCVRCANAIFRAHRNGSRYEKQACTGKVIMLPSSLWMLLLRNRHTYGYWITATAAHVFGDGRFQKPDISVSAASAYLVSSLAASKFRRSSVKGWRDEHEHQVFNIRSDWRARWQWGVGCACIACFSLELGASLGLDVSNTSGKSTLPTDKSVESKSALVL